MCLFQLCVLVFVIVACFITEFFVLFLSVGKREAEEATEKAVVTKKQKKDETALKQAITKQKIETKKKNKKEEYSSSSEEDSSSDSEEEIKVLYLVIASNVLTGFTFFWGVIIVFLPVLFS